DTQPLHGDLHHENILLGDRGWLAIDPKGLVGDPVFDVANLFLNPRGNGLSRNEARAAAMAETLAPALGRPVEQILEWAFAYSLLSAAWHRQDEQPEAMAECLEVSRALSNAMAQIRA